MGVVVAARRRAARTDDALPELTAWQLQVLDAVARSKLASEVVFGGGAALAARHLHHRRSEDLDFFLPRELEDGELRPLTRSLVAGGVRIDEQQVGPRRTLLLLRGHKELGRIDFAFYPYFVRAKFDVGADRLALAQRMLLASGIDELPAMLRPVTPGEIVAFFEDTARALVRRG